MEYNSTNLTEQLRAELTTAVSSFNPRGSLPFGLRNAYGLSVAVTYPQDCDELNRLLGTIGAWALLEQESNVIAGADHALDILLSPGMSHFDIFRLRAALDPYCIAWAETSMTDGAITLTATLSAEETIPACIQFDRERIEGIWGVDSATFDNLSLTFTVDPMRIASGVAQNVARIAGLHLNPATLRELTVRDPEFWSMPRE